MSGVQGAVDGVGRGRLDDEAIDEGFGAVFDASEWLGEWMSFEALIDDGSPAMERAWAQSEEAMRAKRSPFALMLPFFGGSIRRFWRWTCRTGARWQRGAVNGWRVEPPSMWNASDEARCVVGGRGDRGPCVFDIVWLGRFPTGDGGFVCERRRTYRLDHAIARGLEGKPCLVFHAIDAPAGRVAGRGGEDPFRVLIATEPMPGRRTHAKGGLLSHLHFQYASSEGRLLRGRGVGARIRHRLWYPTMVDAHGDETDRCNVVRALHGLPALGRPNAEMESARDAVRTRDGQGRVGVIQC